MANTYSRGPVKVVRVGVGVWDIYINNKKVSQRKAVASGEKLLEEVYNTWKKEEEKKKKEEEKKKQAEQAQLPQQQQQTPTQQGQTQQGQQQQAQQQTQQPTQLPQQQQQQQQVQQETQQQSQQQQAQQQQTQQGVQQQTQQQQAQQQMQEQIQQQTQQQTQQGVQQQTQQQTQQQQQQNQQQQKSEDHKTKETGENEYTKGPVKVKRVGYGVWDIYIDGKKVGQKSAVASGKQLVEEVYNTWKKEEEKKRKEEERKKQEEERRRREEEERRRKEEEERRRREEAQQQQLEQENQQQTQQQTQQQMQQETLQQIQEQAQQQAQQQSQQQTQQEVQQQGQQTQQQIQQQQQQQQNQQQIQQQSQQQQNQQQEKPKDHKTKKTGENEYTKGPVKVKRVGYGVWDIYIDGKKVGQRKAVASGQKLLEEVYNQWKKDQEKKKKPEPKPEPQPQPQPQPQPEPQPEPPPSSPPPPQDLPGGEITDKPVKPSDQQKIIDLVQGDTPNVTGGSYGIGTNPEETVKEEKTKKFDKPETPDVKKDDFKGADTLADKQIGLEIWEQLRNIWGLNPDISTPFFETSVRIDPQTGRPTIVADYNPAVRDVMNKMYANTGALQDAFTQFLNYNLPTNAQDLQNNAYQLQTQIQDINTPDFRELRQINLTAPDLQFQFTPEKFQTQFTQKDFTNRYDPQQYNVGLTTQDWNINLTPEDIDYAGTVADRQAIQNELFQMYTEDIEEDYRKRRQEAEERLLAMGLSPTSQRFQDEMSRIDKERQRAINEARRRAVADSGTEMLRRLEGQLGVARERFGQRKDIQMLERQRAEDKFAQLNQIEQMKMRAFQDFEQGRITQQQLQNQLIGLQQQEDQMRNQLGLQAHKEFQEQSYAAEQARKQWQNQTFQNQLNLEQLRNQTAQQNYQQGLGYYSLLAQNQLSTQQQRMQQDAQRMQALNDAFNRLQGAQASRLQGLTGALNIQGHFANLVPNIPINFTGSAVSVPNLVDIFSAFANKSFNEELLKLKNKELSMRTPGFK